MAKVISSENLSDTLSLSECTDGFWLYDKTRGMNLAMSVVTREKALLKALEYYQKRLKTVEGNYKDLSTKVEDFVSQFSDDSDDYSHLGS